jgi:hypothetical protein
VVKEALDGVISDLHDTVIAFYFSDAVEAAILFLVYQSIGQLYTQA